MRARRYYLDAADGTWSPEVGDVVRFPRVDREVVDVWPTDSRVWLHRWTLTLRTLGEHAARPGRTIIRTVPYRRGEGPAEAFDV